MMHANSHKSLFERNKSIFSQSAMSGRNSVHENKPSLLSKKRGTKSRKGKVDRSQINFTSQSGHATNMVAKSFTPMATAPLATYPATTKAMGKVGSPVVQDLDSNS